MAAENFASRMLGQRIHARRRSRVGQRATQSLALGGLRARNISLASVLTLTFVSDNHDIVNIV
ncbi:hypothetical protein PCAR4_250006 [Paraburkholderia caribensis]|nr:hypothetical protein PCAR4_250006 [Paraburkholderia caribensis]